MTKLEEGCLAIVINSVCGNNGKVVKVGKCLGKKFEKSSIIYWEIDTALPAVIIRTKEKIKDISYIPEYQLLRIDGFDETLDTEEEISKLDKTTTE